MCGRYTLIPNAKALVEFFELPHEILALLEPRYNIAPTQPVLVIREHQKKLVADHMLWGLIPAWSKDGAPNATIINARGESLTQKPSFRDAFKRRRCIIPASGFYEWQKGQPGKKQAFYVQPARDEFFLFAGLWDEWHGPHGECARSCAIVTTTANSLMEPFHDRMPVILQKPAIAEWLDTLNQDTATLAPLLMPLAPSEMRAIPVSSFVNSARNEGPKCLEPAVPEQTLF